MLTTYRSVRARHWLAVMLGILALLQFAQAATPTLTSPGSTQVGAGAATLNFTSDQTGTGYFTLLASSGSCGTGSQVKNGLDGSATAALRFGSLPLTASVTGSYTIRNLSAATAYKVCFTADDGSLLQATPLSGNVTTTASATLAGKWNTIGAARFSADGGVGYTSPAFAPDGTPYVAYQDFGNNDKATVMKLVSNAWTAVDTAGFSAGAAGYTSLAFAPDGTPYVAFSDGSQLSKATVMKLVGSTWTVVGTAGFSTASVSSVSLAFGPDGTPYVAYKDNGNSGYATVMKLVNGTWTVAGTVGFSGSVVAYVSLAIAPDGTPYVAYEDVGNSLKATVMKLVSGAWTVAGTAGFSAGQATHVSLAIAPDGTLYVGYQDASVSKATVMTLIGSTWTAVGGVGFSSGAIAYTSLAVAPDGTPYVVYQNISNNFKAAVMKLVGGAWTAVGTNVVSSTAAYYIMMAFAPDGTPYVAYRDGGSGDSKATVRALRFLDTTTVVTSSAASATSGASITLTATVSNATATGTVNFKDGASSISGCSAQTASAGTATCVTSALGVASHTITAVYSGDDSNFGSTSPGFTQDITAVQTQTTPVSTPAFLVSLPSDAPQVPIVDLSLVLQNAPAGTLLSDNGVVVVPSPNTAAGANVPLLIAANTPNNAVLQLPSGVPTSFVLGGQTFTLTPGSSIKPIQVETKTVTVTDSSGTRTVTSLQVIQGQATLTGASGQVLTAFGASSGVGCSNNVGYLIPLSGDTAVSVDTTAASLLLTGHLDSGSALVHFNACTPAGNVFSASGQDMVVYRGEQIAVDKGAQLVSIIVRSASGTAGDAGDNLAGGLSIDGYRFASTVPQLTKDTGRLPTGSTLQSRLAAQVRGVQSFSGQNALGALRFTVNASELISALPVGAVTVQPGKADGSAVLNSGQVQITANETNATFNAAPRDPARFIADLRNVDRSASVQVVADGSLRVSLNGRILAMQAAWSAFYDASRTSADSFAPAIATATQFCHNADGWQQCYYPVANNFNALQAVVRKADASGSVSEDRSGVLTVTLLGKTYRLLPDWVVFDTPALHANDDYWVDGGRFYIRSLDGYSQGLTVR